VMPWAALLMGCIGACCYRLASKTILRLRIDDPLDAFAVHGACGAWGVIAAALFSDPAFVRALTDGGVDRGGLLYGGTALLGDACIFLVALVAWVGALSLMIFVLLKKLAVLRMPKHIEITAFANNGKDEGDSSTHGGQPYWPNALSSNASARTVADLPTGEEEDAW